ncbi:MAG: energy-coupling factor transporter transmembrane protein EcfT [Desulfosoma sp.]
MARRLALHYVPRSSPVHRLDARTKLLALFLFCTVLLRFSAFALLTITSALAITTAAARLPWALLWRTFRSWLPFLGVIFLVQAFSPRRLEQTIPLEEVLRSGDFLSLWYLILKFFPEDNVFQALISGFRLLLMVLWAVVFTAVTPPRDLQHALLWILQPLPFLPARRIAVMVSLSLRFFTQLLDDLEHIRLAEKARLGDGGFRPWRHVRTSVSALFRKALGRTEATALALAARGYREDLIVEIPPWPKKHGLVLGLFAAVVVFYEDMVLRFWPG